MQSGGQYSVPDIQQFMMERGPPARLLALPAEILMSQPALKPRLGLHSHYFPFPADHPYQYPLSSPVQQQQQQHQHQLQVEEAREEEDAENEWTAEGSLTLVRIGSELDFKMQDSALQASLWQDVSRKLAEVGYRRSAKECSKNFERLNKNARDEKSCRQYAEIEAIYNDGNEMNNRGRVNIPSMDAAMADEGSPSLEKKNKRKRKRKQMASIKVFFENMVKQLMQSQESLHSKLLEAIERQDQERQLRDDAWRRQEMLRLTRETEFRAQEQALASTREAAIVALLQKISGQQVKLPQAPTSSATQGMGIFTDRDFSDVSGKRWPKPEVQALIRLRSSLEPKFQEPGPKGPLWQEISAGMADLGFSNRNAKRCKEKWENINKYFRKTKGTVQKRPQNAKTCPYFHQLEALYRKGILSSPSKCNRTDQLSNPSSDTLPDENIPKELKDNKDHSPQGSENIISEEIMPANNSEDVYIFRSPDDQAQQKMKSNVENTHDLSKSASSDLEAGGSRNDYTFSDSSISLKMERLVKEMAGSQQHKLVQELERRQQYNSRHQNTDLPNSGIPLHQNQIKFIQERSQSVTQSALMALVDKLSAEIGGDYSIHAHPAKQ